MSELYEDSCLFLELVRTPLCLALPKSALASEGDVVSSEMLHDLDLVMMRSGVSAEYDAVYSYLSGMGANHISEIPYYTMGLFADCELNNRAIVTSEIWQDVHPNLECIPFAKPFSIPYGLIFPKNPSPQVMRMYQKAKEISERVQ